MATTPRPPAAQQADLEAVLAASVRALRDATGNLASQFGYRRATLSETLLALGANREDLETMRLFLLAHQPPDSEGT